MLHSLAAEISAGITYAGGAIVFPLVPGGGVRERRPFRRFDEGNNVARGLIQMTKPRLMFSFLQLS